MPTVAQALAAVRSRAIAAGHNPTDAQVLATYNRDVARGDSLGQIVGVPGSSVGASVGGVSTPVQNTPPSGAGPAGGTSTLDGSSLSAGLGSVPPNVLLLGGAAIVLILVLRKK